METISFFKRLLSLVLLVFLQVLMLNRINLFGYVTPILYIMMILKLDSGMSRGSILLWGFFIGLSVDIFSNTLGMHAAAATLLAMLQPALIKLFITVDRRDIVKPSLLTMSKGQFFGYILLASFIHHSIYFLLRTFSLDDWAILIAKVVFSSLLTTLLIFVLELSLGKQENRKIKL